MARRLRVLGPANDKGVPEEELVLARLVQNAKGRGLKACQHTAALYTNGGRKTHVCALGAACLHPNVAVSGSAVVRGNDDLEPLSDDLTSWTIGAAFQDAMR